MKLLKHKTSGRIYAHTAELAERNDMIDYDGPIPGHEPAPEGKAKPRGRGKNKAGAQASTSQEEHLSEARADYTTRFGTAPAPAMTVDQIRAAIAQDEAQKVFDSEQRELPDMSASEEGLPGFGD